VRSTRGLRTSDVGRLREGEDPTSPEPGVQLTPGQWIYRWNQMTGEQRLVKIQGLFEMLDIGYRCFQMDHDGLLWERQCDQARIRQLAAQVYRVRRAAETWVSLADPDAEPGPESGERAAWLAAYTGRKILELLDPPDDDKKAEHHG
jgi:hypothetical protein